MVDDKNQPLSENIPTPAEEGQDAQTILFNLGAFWGLLSLSCWRLQTQGMPELQHRGEANNPTTVQDVFLQAIC